MYSKIVEMLSWLVKVMNKSNSRQIAKTFQQINLFTASKFYQY